MINTTIPLRNSFFFTYLFSIDRTIFLFNNRKQQTEKILEFISSKNYLNVTCSIIIIIITIDRVISSNTLIEYIIKFLNINYLFTFCFVIISNF